MTIKKTISLLLELLSNLSNIPSWVISQLKLSELNSTESCKIETKPVSASYLDFLREQIELQPRGPEWNSVLQLRLNALAPYEGTDITTISVRGADRHFTAYIDHGQKTLIHYEVL
jgi:hypothetical protein